MWRFLMYVQIDTQQGQYAKKLLTPPNGTHVWGGVGWWGGGGKIEKFIGDDSIFQSDDFTRC